MPRTRKPAIFDVMLNLGPSPRTSRVRFDSTSIAIHITDRSSPPGAIGRSFRSLSSSERGRLRSVSAQPCGDDGECWYRRAGE